MSLKSAVFVLVASATTWAFAAPCPTDEILMSVGSLDELNQEISRCGKIDYRWMINLLNYRYQMLRYKERTEEYRKLEDDTLYEEVSLLLNGAEVTLAGFIHSGSASPSKAAAQDKALKMAGTPMLAEDGLWDMLNQDDIVNIPDHALTSYTLSFYRFLITLCQLSDLPWPHALNDIVDEPFEAFPPHLEAELELGLARKGKETFGSSGALRSLYMAGIIHGYTAERKLARLTVFVGQKHVRQILYFLSNPAYRSDPTFVLGALDGAESDTAINHRSWYKGRLEASLRFLKTYQVPYVLLGVLGSYMAVHHLYLNQR